MGRKGRAFLGRVSFILFTEMCANGKLSIQKSWDIHAGTSGDGADCAAQSGILGAHRIKLFTSSGGGGGPTHPTCPTSIR